MKRAFAWSMVFATLFYVLVISLVSATAQENPWRLVWADEFDKPGRPDATKWNYFVGGGGLGNNEQQFYTDRTRNAWVEDGKLVIEARKEKYKGHEFTSARLESKFDFKYGRVEARAKMMKGEGVWPAIWMLARHQTYGDDIWPDNGEMDIVEYVGRDPGNILSCFYTKNFNWMKGTGITAVREVAKLAEKFHVYGLEWDENEASISVDGVRYNTFKNPRTNWEDWPLDQNYYIILNLALGGFGGDVDPKIFPRKLQVDYVRVYQKTSSLK